MGYEIVTVEYFQGNHSLRVMGVHPGEGIDDAEHVTELSGPYTHAKHLQIAEASNPKTKWRNIEPFTFKQENL